MAEGLRHAHGLIELHVELLADHVRAVLLDKGVHVVAEAMSGLDRLLAHLGALASLQQRAHYVEQLDEDAMVATVGEHVVHEEHERALARLEHVVDNAESPQRSVKEVHARVQLLFDHSLPLALVARLNERDVSELGHFVRVYAHEVARLAEEHVLHVVAVVAKDARL